MIYTFKCSKCSHQVELVMPLKKYLESNKMVKCEKCGGDSRRVYEPVPFKAPKWN